MDRVINQNKLNLLNWCVWFFTGNILLYWLIGLNYFTSVGCTISWLDTAYHLPYSKLAVILFTVTAYMGHLGLLAILPCVFLIPLILIFPNRKLIFTLAISIASITTIFLAMDAFTYKMYRFHLNGTLGGIAIHGLTKDVFGFSFLEYALSFTILSSMFIIESIYAYWLNRVISTKQTLQGHFKWVVVALVLCWYMAFSMFVTSNGYIMHSVFQEVSGFIPLYTKSLDVLTLTNDDVVARKSFSHDQDNVPLHYPLKPLTYAASKPPLNLLILVIDTWRADMMGPTVSPNIYHFAKQSMVFKQHFSGGNATGPGIFSLFYGIPANYWTATEDQQQSPVFINALLKQHYQLGIFGSASLRIPAFDKNVFSKIDIGPDTQGATTYLRDKAITQEFKNFIEEAVKHPDPFFSFLFYDAVHGYCSFDEDLQPLQPAVKSCDRVGFITDPVPYANRYKNALLLVDQEVKQVLDTLQSHHLLKNTVVIITGDHGDEFNDNHMGYWGHSSNFTHYQVQTPFILYWPGRKPKIINYRTSHFDIVPTLMQNLFGCNTATYDYTVGKNLFDVHQPPYLIVGSYVTSAIVEPDRIDKFSPMGDLNIENVNNELLPDATIRTPVILSAERELNRFYKAH